MAIVNRTKKEINAKLVYFGPPASGKKSNLEYIYKKLKAGCRGQFKAVPVQSDRMLFFDFLPGNLSEVNGYNFRFHIYTLAGAVSQPSAWKMVLKGVDGIVFVADSDKENTIGNVESITSLREILSSYGLELADVPAIIQCNKQDLAGAVTPEEMGRLLTVGSLPILGAKAKKGDGVITTLNRIVTSVMEKVRQDEPEIFASAEEGGGAVKKKSAGSSAASLPPMDELASLTIAQAAVEQTPHSGGALPERGKVALSPVVEMAGDVEMVGAGKLRLPLAISCGENKKTVTLTITVALDGLTP
jgi:signal recognition particle receptor subunit beta